MGRYSETRLDPTDLREIDASGPDGPRTVGTCVQVDGRFTNRTANWSLNQRNS
jgi:hypothetical protein